MKSELTYTVEDFIKTTSMGNISFEQFSFLDKSNEIIMITYNILNDYKDEIDELTVTVNLTDDEFLKYCYKPRMLSYDIYGDTEMFFIILFVNNICSAKEFNKRKIKMLRKSHMEDVLSLIYNSEKYNIIKNRNKVEI